MTSCHAVPVTRLFYYKQGDSQYYKQGDFQYFYKLFFASFVDSFACFTILTPVGVRIVKRAKISTKLQQHSIRFEKKIVTSYYNSTLWKKRARWFTWSSCLFSFWIRYSFKFQNIILTWFFLPHYYSMCFRWF